MLKHVNEPQTSDTWRSSLAQTRLDGDAIREVLARASELQTNATETMSVAELENLAREMGVSPQFVRQAVAERYASPSTVAPITNQTSRELLVDWLLSFVAPTPRQARRRGWVFGISLVYALLMSVVISADAGRLAVLLLLVGCPLLVAYLGAATKHKRRGARYGAFLATLTMAAPLLTETFRSTSIPPPPGEVLAILCLAATVGAIVGTAGAFIGQAAARRDARLRRTAQRAHR